MAMATDVIPASQENEGKMMLSASQHVGIIQQGTVYYSQSKVRFCTLHYGLSLKSHRLN